MWPATITAHLKCLVGIDRYFLTCPLTNAFLNGYNIVNWSTITFQQALMGTSTFLQYLQRAAGRWEAQGKQIWNTSRSFAPNVIPDGYITGSINKLQRIGTRYSAGVLAESAIFICRIMCDNSRRHSCASRMQIKVVTREIPLVLKWMRGIFYD